MLTSLPYRPPLTTFSQPRFTIQDLTTTITKAPTTLPPEIQSRISFTAHNFFTDQPIQDADVYSFRWIFHDWSDLYCMKILRALIPGLSAGTKIIISEMCLPEYGSMNLFGQKLLRSMDMVMKAQFNSRERHKSEWISLFRKTDSRFKVESVQRPMKSKLSFLIVTWNP